MALNWSQLSTTGDTKPPIVTIYGGEGRGKTTLGSEFPNPYYVRCGANERTPTGADMVSFGKSETFQDVLDQADWMLEGEHDRLTLVLDTLDGLETMIYAEACARNNWSSIEEPGFGKGYVAAMDVWQEFLRKVVALKDAGFAVVLIAHARVKTDPGVTTDSYPRFRVNVRDDAANAVVAASDLVCFIHQRVSIAKEDAGFKKVNKRGEGGGDLVIAVEERPGFVAKNRYDMPASIPFKRHAGYEALAGYFPAPTGRQGADDGGASPQ